MKDCLKNEVIGLTGVSACGIQRLKKERRELFQELGFCVSQANTSVYREMAARKRELVIQVLGSVFCIANVAELSGVSTQTVIRLKRAPAGAGY